MRVMLLCLDRGAPIYGIKGCSIHLRSVAMALHRGGHEVRVVAARRGNNRLGEPELPFPIDVIEKDEDSRKLRSLMHTVAPDLVLERLSLMSSAGAVVAATLGTPHVYEINAPLDQEAEKHRGFGNGEAARWKFREGFAHSSGAVAVSQEVADWASDLAPMSYSVHTVPNGVDPMFFEEPDRPSRERVARKLHYPRGLRIAYSGSFKAWHDLTSLIRATARVHDRMPVQLVFIGDGPRVSETISATWKANLPSVFTGPVPHHQMPAMLNACDIVAVPYADESAYFSPLKLAEAMATGRAVIASATGPCRRVLEDGKTGLLTRPGDVRSLSSALMRLARQPQMRRRLGDAAKREARKKYTWDNVVRQVLEFAQATGTPRGGQSR